MELSGIKNIIFDLGNVILDINYELTLEAFSKFGEEKFDHEYSKQQQSIIIDLLETGKIGHIEFVNQIRDFFEEYISEDDLVNAWNSMILDFKEERIDLVKKLSEEYNVFLLSNTNFIHYEYFSNKFKRQFGYRFKDLFKKAFLSHEIGYRKPSNFVFDYITKGGIIKPSESLFIDDLEENTEAAKKMGFNVHHLKEGEDIIELFS